MVAIVADGGDYLLLAFVCVAKVKCQPYGIYIFFGCEGSGYFKCIVIYALHCVLDADACLYAGCKFSNLLIAKIELPVPNRKTVIVATDHDRKH